MEGFTIIGPAWDGRQTVFREVGSSAELTLNYVTTMLAPGKLHIYRPKEKLFRFSLSGRQEIGELPAFNGKQIIVGVHPCDTNAILYLDRTFLGEFKDPFYEARRNNTIIISLNCTDVAPDCFCRSMGTGPFLNADSGFDMLLTDFGDDFLVEVKTERVNRLFNVSGARRAGNEEFALKAAKEKSALLKFTKTIDIAGLDSLLRDNPEHPVWGQTSDERCLSCSNCVMVCPTCFCYDVVDEISMDMKTAVRHRQLDACQDRKFAEVHGGNFRARRAARLRQFVTHKLDHTRQYGVFGTVGCGRCITWCPTGIDLTEIAKEIQRTKR